MPRHCQTQIGILTAGVLCGGLLFGCFTSSLHAQYLQETGSPTFATSEDVPMGFVNVANGNLHIEIPFVASPQRGGRMLTGKMVYDSRIWKIVDTGSSQSWQPTNVPGTQIGIPGAQMGWRFVYTGGGTAAYDTTTSSCLSGGTYYYWQRYQNYRFTDENGTTRYFPLTGETSVPCHTAATPTTTGPSLDATGYQMNRSSWNWPDNVVAPDGTQVYVYKSGSSTIWKDPNGNYMEKAAGSGNIIDTLDRTVIQKTDISGGLETDYTVLTSSGSSTFKVFYTIGTVNMATNFGVPGVTEYSGGLQAVTRIQLPDGSTYSFQYENDLPYSYGLLKSMTVPTGDVVSFTHANFTDAQGATQRWVHTVTQGGGAWTYTPVTCGANCNQVTSTRPSGDETAYTFALNGGGAWNTLTKAYTGSAASGTLSLTAAYDYDTSLTNPITGGSGFIRRIRATTTVPGPSGNLIKKTEGTFDTFSYSYQGGSVTGSLGNSKTLKEYAYGGGTTGGLVHQMVMSYLHESNPSYAGKNLVKLATDVQTLNASSVLIAETTSTYDSTALTSAPGITHHDDTNFGGSFTVRGNATVTQSWTGSGYLATTSVYDTTGQLLSSTDPNGNTTQLTYTNNFYNDNNANPPAATSAPPAANAYVTAITTPVSGTYNYGYYYGSGRRAFNADQNSKTTYMHYMDPLDRPTTENLPAGGYIENTYSTATHIIHNKAVPSGTFQDQHDNDSLGRPGTGSLNDPEGTTYGVVHYDTSGRVLSSTNPYRSVTDPTYGANALAYDGLNRITQLTRQDGNSTQAYYGASAGSSGGITTPLCATGTYGFGYPTLYIDEAGKKRQNWSDAFGKVIEVDEPDSTGSLTLATCSKYDGLGNLVEVDQGSQSRTWVYDGLSRLTGLTTPEGGTQTNFYTTSGGALCSGDPQSVCRSTDARGVTTTFTYDAENRLTGKSYSNGDPAVTYYYDQTSYNGLTITNGKGRRTGMSDGSGETAWSYNSQGAILTIHRTIAGVTKDISYSYNVDGSVNRITYPSGLVLTNNYDTAGRLTQVSCSSYYCYGTAFGSSAAYNAFGSLSSLTQGISGSLPSGISLSWSYNNRYQPVNTTAAVGSTTLLNLTYSFLQAGGKNNGTVVSITNGVVPGRSQTFTYDELNRLKTAQSAATSGADCWGQSFSYDRYGNLGSITVTKCAAPALSLVFNGNNQISSSGFAFDAAGNLTGNGSSTYTWTAEDQLASTAGVSYTYDGDGLRVEKSGGTLYWYGGDGAVLAESDLSGAIQSEYIYFSGRRIARRDPGTGNAYYYLTDNLGSARLMTNAAGAVVDESEFYPFGTERVITSGLGNNYKFAGMERDPESSLDHTLYRKYSSSLARWLSPDPDTGSPDNPQSLNRYPYVLNDPADFVDTEGNSISRGFGLSIATPLVGCFPESPLSQSFGCGWDESSPCPPGFVAIYGQPSPKGGPAIETLQSDLDYADVRLGPYSLSVLTYDLGPNGLEVKMSLSDFQMLAQFNPVLGNNILDRPSLRCYT